MQRTQGGKIGISLIGRWFVPLNEASVSDQMAAGRAIDFIVGWFLDPLVYGDYPKIMKDALGERLPRFTLLESQLVKGSIDFLGLNYYFTQYATDSLRPISTPPNIQTDPRANFSCMSIHQFLIHIFILLKWYFLCPKKKWYFLYIFLSHMQLGMI